MNWTIYAPVTAGLFFYFAPTFIALLRDHPAWMAIAVLNFFLTIATLAAIVGFVALGLFFGFAVFAWLLAATVLAWIGTLIWAGVGRPYQMRPVT